jgi:hypothetical protein
MSHECYPYAFYCYQTVPCGYTGDVPDMEIGKAGCALLCPSQNVCLRPDRSECWIGLDSKGQDPLLKVTWDERAPNLSCVYDLDRIDSIDQLRAFDRQFNSDSLNNNLVGAFCGKHVSSHCADGLGGECSRYLSLDEGGKLCREWLSLRPRDVQDAAMREYCLNNNTLDCKCINRTTDPDYSRLKSLGNYFSDGCWFKPCSNSESIYLVPNRVSSAQCATNVCQQIIDAHAQGKVDITGNVNQINCSFAENDLTPSARNPVTWYEWLSTNWIVSIGMVLTIIIALLI